MTRWTLDSTASTVRIDARSNVHPIHVEVAATGHLDLEVTGGVVTAIEHAVVEVAAGSLASGNPLVDAETRRRIDVRRHPTIAGRLTAATPVADGRFQLEGDVTLVGVTRPVAGEVTLNVNEEGVSITGATDFDVRDWGLRPPRLLVLRVEPTVSVRLRAQAVRDAAPDGLRS